MERNCGGCTACCKTHGILSLMKMPGVWCQYCKTDKGCGIYEKRPAECREFKCSWLMGIGGERHRPDKTRIVPEYREIPGIGMVMWFWEVREGSLDSCFTKSWTRRNLLAGNCVMHASLTGNHKLYLPQSLSDFHLSFVLNERNVDIVLFEQYLALHQC